MTILAPSEALDTAPTPTCEIRYKTGGFCGKPAELLWAVRQPCCGANTPFAACLACYERYKPHPVNCTECKQRGVLPQLSEPVRLRGAASDGRTE